MSAFIVDKTHIDLMIRAALRSRPAGSPGNSGPFRFWRTDEDGNYAGWYEIQPDAESRTDDDYTHYLTPSQAGQILVGENVASVSYRYSEPGRTPYYGAEAAAGMDTLTDLPGPCDAYYVAPYEYEDPHYTLTPAEVFAAIDCLDYQSCEHPVWRKSDAFAFCEALRDAYCRRVPGYSDAPWEFRAEHVRERVHA